MDKYEFKNLEKQPTKNSKSNIDLLEDMPIKLDILLGSKEIPIKNVLSFSKGTIVELDTPVEEPVAICVDRKAIAKGEVVVIDGKLAIKINDIIGGK